MSYPLQRRCGLLHPDSAAGAGNRPAQRDHDPRPYSHAWFPREQFDRVEQSRSWTFAQKVSGYLALYAQRPTQWSESGPYAGKELRCDVPDTIWVCELGEEAYYGSFEAFQQRILDAQVNCNGLNVAYQSPSLGEIRFGWPGPLTVNGEEVALHGYPRFDRPYVESAIGERC